MRKVLLEELSINSSTGSANFKKSIINNNDSTNVNDFINLESFINAEESLLNQINKDLKEILRLYLIYIIKFGNLRKIAQEKSPAIFKKLLGDLKISDITPFINQKDINPYLRKNNSTEDISNFKKLINGENLLFSGIFPYIDFDNFIK